MAPCRTNEATEGTNLLTPQLGRTALRVERRTPCSLWSAARVLYPECRLSVAQSGTPLLWPWSCEVWLNSFLRSTLPPPFSKVLLYICFTESTITALLSSLRREDISGRCSQSIASCVNALGWETTPTISWTPCRFQGTENRCHCIIKINASKEKHYLSEVTIL